MVEGGELGVDGPEGSKFQALKMRVGSTEGFWSRSAQNCRIGQAEKQKVVQSRNTTEKDEASYPIRILIVEGDEGRERCEGTKVEGREKKKNI